MQHNKCPVCIQHTNIYPDSDVLFLYVGYYILVYLQGYFLHCINTRQQEMLCHSLFLSGKTRLLYKSCLRWVMSVKQLYSPLFSATVRACTFRYKRRAFILSRQPQGLDVDLGLQCQSANITVLHAEEESSGGLLDLASGRIHTAELSPAYLLQMLRSETPSRWAWFITLCGNEWFMHIEVII